MSIPRWPMRPYGCIPVEELFAEMYNEDGPNWNRGSARMYSEMFRNGKPMVCIGCGAQTDKSGELPCDH